MPVTITTNNVPRDVIPWYELTLKERDQFGYMDWRAIEDGREYAEFFRFKGQLYDLNDMERLCGCGMPHILSGWDNYISDSFFSGIVIKYRDNGERVIVGTYYAS